MPKETKIDEVTESGRYLFVYSDRHNCYFFFHRSDNKLFKITTDKLLNIENVDPIEVPRGFYDYTSVKFFKPYTQDLRHSFIGIVLHGDQAAKFSVENDTVVYKERIDYIPNNQFNILSCLKDVDIVSHIQKKNRLFLVGYDHTDGGNEPIYAVVDVEKDRFEQVYYLYSDQGDLEINTINIDTDDKRVYIAGSIKVEAKQSIEMKPYFEMFLLKN